MNIKSYVKQIVAFIDSVPDAPNPLSLNQLFTESFNLVPRGVKELKMLEVMYQLCVPSIQHTDAVNEIENRLKIEKAFISVVSGDNGSGKTAFMVYVWQELKKKGFMVVPPMQHANPKDIVEATMKWIKSSVDKKYFDQIDAVMKPLVDVKYNGDSLKTTEIDLIRTVSSVSAGCLVELARLCKNIGKNGLVILVDEMDYGMTTARDGDDTILRATLEIFRTFVRSIKQSDEALAFLMSVVDWDVLQQFGDYAGFTTSFSKNYSMNIQQRDAKDRISSKDIWDKWLVRIAEFCTVSPSELDDPVDPLVFKAIDSICFMRPGTPMQNRMRGVIRILMELLHNYTNSDIDTIGLLKVPAILTKISLNGIDKEGLANLYSEVSELTLGQSFSETARSVVSATIPFFNDGVLLNSLKTSLGTSKDFQDAVDLLAKLEIVEVDSGKIALTFDYMKKFVSTQEQDLSVSKILKQIVSKKLQTIYRFKGLEDVIVKMLSIEGFSQERVSNASIRKALKLADDPLYACINAVGSIEDHYYSAYWNDRRFLILIFSDPVVDSIVQYCADKYEPDATIVFSTYTAREHEVQFDLARRLLKVELGKGDEFKIETIKVNMLDGLAIYHFVQEKKLIRYDGEVNTILSELMNAIGKRPFFDSRVNDFQGILLTLLQHIFPEYKPILTKAQTLTSQLENLFNLLTNLPFQHKDFGARVPPNEFEQVISNVITRHPVKQQFIARMFQWGILSTEVKDGSHFTVIEGLHLEKMLVNKMEEGIKDYEILKKLARDWGYREREFDHAIDFLVKARNLYEIKTEQTIVEGTKVNKKVLNKKLVSIDSFIDIANIINDIIVEHLSPFPKELDSDIKKAIDGAIASRKNIDVTLEDVKRTKGNVTSGTALLYNMYKQYLKDIVPIFNGLSSFVKDDKNSLGLYHRLKNASKETIPLPDPTLSDVSNELNDVYKNLKKIQEDTTQNGEILKKLEEMSKVFLSVSEKITDLIESNKPPETVHRKEVASLRTRFEKLKAVEALQIGYEKVSANNAFIKFLEDFVAYNNLLSSKEKKSQFDTLNIAKQVLADKTKIDEEFSSSLDSIQTHYANAISSLKNALVALALCIEKREENEKLILVFRTTNLKDLTKLLGLVKLKDELDALLDGFRGYYEARRNCLNEMVTKCPNYQIDASLVYEKIDKSFPNLARPEELKKKLATGNQTNSNFIEIGKDLLNMIYDKIKELKRDLETEITSINTILNIADLKSDYRSQIETVRKHASEVENVIGNGIKRINSDASLKTFHALFDEANKEITMLKKERRFLDDFWKVYQLKIDTSLGLKGLKEKLIMHQDIALGKINLKEYILDLVKRQNLKLLKTNNTITEEIERLGKDIIDLVIRGHLKVFIEVIGPVDE